MKLHYYPETDSLYIELSTRAGQESREAAPGVVLDFDAEGRIVGIDIDRASEVVDLDGLTQEPPTGETLDSLLEKTSGIWRGADGLRYQQRLRAEWEDRTGRLQD